MTGKVRTISLKAPDEASPGLLTCRVETINMASIGVRMSRASRSLLHVPSIPKSFVRGKRGLASTTCLRHQASPARLHLSQVPADKYQRTTITEDVQRAAAEENWADPRGNAVNFDQISDEAMMDPTIRHFTVNFVSRLIVSQF